MEGASAYLEVLLLLGGAVVFASLFKKIGFGTILGYLAGGVVIGPMARLVTEGEELLHVSELGVVLLLFIIGLELKPSQLWAMRRDIFGLGLAQVAAGGAALTLLAMVAAGFDWRAAVVTGFGLALSSTAFTMQTLRENGESSTVHGQRAFSILLFQDLAIVPLLALLPLLTHGADTEATAGLRAFGLAVLAVTALLVAGRFLLNPLFRIIASSGAHEIMIAAALLVVIGAATLMAAAGMSMALGAFLAGVMLAESSYRHELRADIEPFRGLLLGLFFMAVGLSLKLDVVLANWAWIALAVPALMTAKAVTTYAACRAFGSAHPVAVRVALLLPQGGEFAFVLFTAAASRTILTDDQVSLLIAAVTCSMALMPAVAPLARFLTGSEKEESMSESFDGAGADVLLIGFSRFGQIASQILLTGGTDVTIIENSAERVRSASRFGFRIYFGDGTRKEVLEAAGIRRAKIVAVCTNKRDVTDAIVALVQRDFPQARLYVRSYDRTHTLQLRAQGVEYELRETLESGLAFGRRTLEGLGMDEEQAEAILEDVRRRDEERLALQALGEHEASQRRWHTRPVSPEPLVRPRRVSRRLDKTGPEANSEDAAGDGGPSRGPT